MRPTFKLALESSEIRLSVKRVAMQRDILGARLTHDCIDISDMRLCL
jgi:hypothetical protein